MDRRVGDQGSSAMLIEHGERCREGASVVESPTQRAFRRSRFVSFAQCGDDRFLLRNERSGQSAHVTEAVVGLWLSLDDKTTYDELGLLGRFEDAWTSSSAPDDSDRRALFAVFNQLLSLGAIEDTQKGAGYDSVADDYDARPTPIAPLMSRIAAHTDRVHREGVVLEVACGTGQVLERLADFSPTRLHGVDISTPMLECARQKLSSTEVDVRIEQAMAERLPLENDSVDLLVVSTALHWFDQSAFWEEVRRVVATNHKIIICNSVLDAADLNPLRAFFGSGLSHAAVSATLRSDTLSLLSEKPAWVGIRHFENFPFHETYSDAKQLKQVARSWCPPESHQVREPLVTEGVEWPLAVPFVMSFAVLEIV